jgi:ketosteroid isomerase-like protein
MGEPTGNDNLEIARNYVQALEQGETGAALGRFFAPDVVLEEFPNRLTPLGKTRDLAAALEGAERGKKAMSRQKYKIKQEIAKDDRVALEVEWVGTLAVPFGSIPAGGQMKAFFAVFLEFREGKIMRQRNYDCFEAW